MLSLAVDGTVGEMDPGLLSEFLGDALLVLADSGLFFLENDGDACESVSLIFLLVKLWRERNQTYWSSVST